jgi:ribosomal protein S24E
MIYFQAIRVIREPQEQLVKQALKELKGLKERKELRVKVDHQDLLVQEEVQAQLAQLVKQDQLALAVLVERLGRRVNEVTLEILEPREYLGQKVKPGLQVLLDQPDQQDLVDHQANKVLRVKLDLKDPLDPKVKMDSLVLQVKRASEARLVPLDQQVPRDPKELKGKVDHQAHKDNVENLGKLGKPVRFMNN